MKKEKNNVYDTEVSRDDNAAESNINELTDYIAQEGSKKSNARDYASTERAVRLGMLASVADSLKEHNHARSRSYHRRHDRYGSRSRHRNSRKYRSRSRSSNKNSSNSHKGMYICMNRNYNIHLCFVT